MRTSIRFLPTADAEASRYDAALASSPPCEARAEMETGPLVTQAPFGASPNLLPDGRSVFVR
jgi:hypothetical protein